MLDAFDMSRSIKLLVSVDDFMSLMILLLLQKPFKNKQHFCDFLGTVIFVIY
jgi:hypothetical protein